jgi:hypothetical protein
MSGAQMMIMNNVQPVASPGLSIVTSNLQMYLNAASSASYPGSGFYWYDLSVNAYTTDLVGSPPWNSTYFSFNSQFVDTGQILKFENFSVGAWFRTSAAGTKMILSKEQSGGYPWNYRIWLNGGQIVGDIAQASSATSTITSPLTNYNNNSWYLAMFTRNDSTLTLYVNGSQVNSVSDTLTGSILNDQELWIGLSAYLGGSYSYVGDIGQVFIYDRVLNSSEILQNFNVTKATYGL